jgi:hypothetical protein
MFSQELLIVLFRLVHRIHPRGPSSEWDLVSLAHAKISRANFHAHFLDAAGHVDQVVSLGPGLLANLALRLQPVLT